MEERGSTGNYKEDVFQSLLMDRRTILLNDKVEDSIIERVVIPIIGINDSDDEAEEELKGYNRNDNPIHIFINTDGGFADQALACMSAIESSKTPIYTYAMGKAYSAGFLILVAGHKRFCQKYSNLMYHQMQLSTGYNSLAECKDTIDEAMITQSIVDEIVLSRTKITEDKLREINTNKTNWYVRSKEALELNIVDELYY